MVQTCVYCTIIKDKWPKKKVAVTFNAALHVHVGNFLTAWLAISDKSLPEILSVEFPRVGENHCPSRHVETNRERLGREQNLDKALLTQPKEEMWWERERE